MALLILDFRVLELQRIQELHTLTIIISLTTSSDLIIRT